MLRLTPDSGSSEPRWDNARSLVGVLALGGTKKPSRCGFLGTDKEEIWSTLIVLHVRFKDRYTGLIIRGDFGFLPILS
jgi:hypothetical protein